MSETVDTYLLNMTIDLENTTAMVSASVSPEMSQLDTVIGFMYFYCTLVMSVLSMIGSMVIILCNVCTEETTTTGRKILIYLSVADFLTAFGNLMGIIWYVAKDGMSERSSESMCEFHASLTIFSSCSSYFWAVFMTIFLYLCTLVRHHGWDDKLLYAAHVTCWLVPATIAILVLSMGVIGWDDLPFPSWCWIDTSLHNAVMWQYLSGKFWEILAFIIIVTMITIIKVKLIKQLRKQHRTRSETSTSDVETKSRKKNIISETNKKLTFVPVIFLLCRVWGTVRFIVNTHFPDAKQGGAGVAIVALLQGLGDSAQGFANCILFIITTDKFKQKLKRDVQMCCRCDRLCQKRCCSKVTDETQAIEQSSTETEQPHSL